VICKKYGKDYNYSYHANAAVWEGIIE